MIETGKRADVFHAIGDANRRRLLDLLRDEERSVQALVPHLGITVGAVSQHLKILLESGLVVRRKQGRFRFYRAEPRALKKVHDWTARYRRFWESRLDRLGNYLDQNE
jgi:DNA-binding transcriptional ArsR family regulator